MSQQRWTAERVDAALSFLLQQGIVWVDEQAVGEVRFYFPSLFVAVAKPVSANGSASANAEADSEVDFDAELASLARELERQEAAEEKR